MTITEARKNLADIANQAFYTGEVTLLTRHGKELAAVAPINLLQTREPKAKKKAQRET